MSRTTGRLTALAVARAKKPGLYADGGGLALQVKSTGRSWVYRYMLKGRARTMGLGPASLYSLAEARAKALEARRLRHEGVDPIEARNAGKDAAMLADAKAITFKQCATGYIAAHRAGWRNAIHAAQWESTLATFAEPIIGSLPVGAIDTALVMKVLEQEVREAPTGQLWTARHETAARLRGRIESVLAWATVRGYRTGENPAIWKNHLDQLLPSRQALRKVRPVKHLAAMPYAEVPGFMVALQAQDGMGARPLEFSILTAARAGQTFGARWNEINLAEKTWTIPGLRMKAGGEHRVPLSDRALAILREMKLASDDDQQALIFPGGTPGKQLSNRAMLDVLARTGHGNLTVHGFRSSFRDWAAERTNVAGEVAEAALAHVVGDKTEEAYKRTDLFNKRRKLMDAWAAYCATPKTGKVVPLHGARAMS